MKLVIPDKYKNATEILGVRLPTPGAELDVPDATGARLKRFGFKESTKTDAKQEKAKAPAKKETAKADANKTVEGEAQ